MSYFVFQYLQYATMVTFDPLFLVYVVIFALSAVAFFLNLRRIDVSRLPARVSARFPRRLFIVFTLAMSVALILLWLGRIIPYTLADRFPDELAGLTMLVSQAIDLGMVVPLLLSTAFLLWRRSAWGYLLAGISLTFCCSVWRGSMWPGGFSGVYRRKKRAHVAKWHPYDGCGPTQQPTNRANAWVSGIAALPHG